MLVYFLHTHTHPSTFLRDRNFFGSVNGQTDHIFSDRNGVPIKKFGNSDGIGIFSEFRSEFATKLLETREENNTLKLITISIKLHYKH